MYMLRCNIYITHIYVYMTTYIYTNIYTYINIHIRTSCKHTYTDICIYPYLYTHDRDLSVHVHIFSCSASNISNQKWLNSYRDQVTESGDTLSEIRGLIALTSVEATFWIYLESLTLPLASKHSGLLRI